MLYWTDHGFAAHTVDLPNPLPELALSIDSALDYVDNFDVDLDLTLMDIDRLVKFPCEIDIPFFGSFVKLLWGEWVLPNDCQSCVFLLESSCCGQCIFSPLIVFGRFFIGTSAVADPLEFVRVQEQLDEYLESVWKLLYAKITRWLYGPTHTMALHFRFGAAP